MPLLHAPAKTAADPRTLPGAYISSGRNLYYVLGRDLVDLVVVEDCLTLDLLHAPVGDLLGETTLVRAARV